MTSRRLIAARRAIPQQIELRSLVVGLEQIGADRLPEAGIVKLQGDIVARLFPGAFPARANFWADLGAINIARDGCDSPARSPRLACRPELE
jgi:hypothetical protein